MVEGKVGPSHFGIVDQRVKKLPNGAFQAALRTVGLNGEESVLTGLGSDIPSALAAIKSLRVNAVEARFRELKTRLSANGNVRTEGNRFGHNFGPGERLKEYLVQHREQDATAIYDRSKNTYVSREEL